MPILSGGVLVDFVCYADGDVEPDEAPSCA